MMVSTSVELAVAMKAPHGDQLKLIKGPFLGDTCNTSFLDLAFQTCITCPDVPVASKSRKEVHEPQRNQKKKCENSVANNIEEK